MNEVTADSLLIVSPRNRGGRPKVSERKVPLTVNVPPAYFDRIQKLAQAEGEHLSVFTCRLLGEALGRFRN